MIDAYTFTPGEPHGIDPSTLGRIEGDRTSVVLPHGSAHFAKAIVDTHPELLISMVSAARKEYGHDPSDA